MSACWGCEMKWKTFECPSTGEVFHDSPEPMHDYKCEDQDNDV